jgi:hypothetical protein
MNSKDLKEMVEKFYQYTIEISITEDDLLGREYFKLEQLGIDMEEIGENVLKEEVYKGILYDLIFNVNGIKNQLLNDLSSDLFDEGDLVYIKEIYKELKDFGIDIYIEELEK